MSRRDNKKKSRRDEPGITTRIVSAFTLQSINLDDDWFIF